MLEEIDAVNWGELPGPRDLYEPDRVATGLRALATASGLVQAAGAGSLLAGGGLVHDHSAPHYPLSDRSPDEVCLRMDGARLDEVAPPAVLFPGRCGSGSADR
ncbi:hypothetical protein ACWEIM_00380 [Streptomyces sp. NPDC004778]